MNTLIIVESPYKVPTIKSYLGKGYKVTACKGHVRDLPKSKLGVDIENDFALHGFLLDRPGALILQHSRLHHQVGQRRNRYRNRRARKHNQQRKQHNSRMIHAHQQKHDVSQKEKYSLARRQPRNPAELLCILNGKGSVPSDVCRNPPRRHERRIAGNSRHPDEDQPRQKQ